MKWWFKRHPDLLRRESRALSSNSNYHERFQSRNNYFVSCGEILVRLEKTVRYPILIVYPDSTPYSLPFVFPLERTFEENDIINISSSKNLDELIEHIKDNIKFWYRRHQNPNGSLCLLENDNLEMTGAEFFDANSIIGRLRQWFAGFTTGKLPPDSPEVDLFSHFPNQNKNCEFLFPETFYYKDIVQGEFFGLCIALIPGSEKRIFLGILLNGLNRAGVHLDPIEFKSSFQAFPDGINRPLDLLTKKNMVNSAIGEGKLIRGYWWDIAKEPSPFGDADGLARPVGNGDLEIGYKKIFDSIGEEIKTLNNEVIICLRYPNRKEELEWQAFSLSKGEVEKPPLIGSSDIENFKEVLTNYKIAAIRTEAITDSTYHKRNSILADRDLLKDKKVNVIGCGALGSEIADSLAKAGLGAIGLVDFEEFRAHNGVRHVLGVESIGIPKVYALDLHLRNHNMFVQVRPKNCDILTTNINDYLLDDSISVSSIADDNIEGFLNEQAIIYNKTIFYVRALRGGKAARIFRVIPGVDACLNCLSLYKKTDERFITIPEDPQLPTITNECNNPIRPASAPDLKLISSLLSRLVINFLQNEPTNKNHWIWTMEVLESGAQKLEPFSLHTDFFEPSFSCSYCKKEDPMKIRIDNEAYEFMQQEILKEPEVETGGVLAGSKLENGDIKVHYASAPGPNAVTKETEFRKDVNFCQAYLDEKYRNEGVRAIYVGEWHYHPSLSNQPSNIDLASLSQISLQKEYLTIKPVMIIFSSDGKASCTVHPADKKFYFCEYEVEQSVE